MPITSDQIVQEILAREAGLEDNPLDRGGITKYGITLSTLRQVRPDATADDIRALSSSEAAAIYQKLYVAPFTEAAAGDDYFLALLADSAVQHGVARVRSWLAEGATAYAQLLTRRIQFYGEIVVAHPDQLAFLRCWLSRVTKFIR